MEWIDWESKFKKILWWGWNVLENILKLKRLGMLIGVLYLHKFISFKIIFLRFIYFIGKHWTSFTYVNLHNKVGLFFILTHLIAVFRFIRGWYKFVQWMKKSCWNINLKVFGDNRFVLRLMMMFWFYVHLIWYI